MLGSHPPSAAGCTSVSRRCSPLHPLLLWELYKLADGGCKSAGAASDSHGSRISSVRRSLGLAWRGTFGCVYVMGTSTDGWKRRHDSFPGGRVYQRDLARSDEERQRTCPARPAHTDTPCSRDSRGGSIGIRDLTRCGLSWTGAGARAWRISRCGIVAATGLGRPSAPRAAQAAATVKEAASWA
jgi:hypothetical protein